MTSGRNKARESVNRNSKNTAAHGIRLTELSYIWVGLENEPIGFYQQLSEGNDEKRG